MARRFIRQPHVSSIYKKVENARRPDADPLFNEIAHEAAMNGLNDYHCGGDGVTFLQPTDNPRSYYSLLKLLKAEGPKFRRDLTSHKFGPDTINRCVAAGFICVLTERNPLTKRNSMHFNLSAFGSSYLKLAAPYVVRRSSQQVNAF